MAVGLKICGVRGPADVRTCAELGVPLVGINLWRGSPRGLTLAEARALVSGWPAGGPGRVGVFVDPSLGEVERAVEALRLDAVQLHGDADPRPVARAGIPYVWVLRGTPPLERLELPDPPPRWVLLDAAVRGYGGAGVTTDWAWAARAVSWLAPTPVWLAGGLRPDNAGEAIERVRPAGIDVASGAERPGAAPGTKDRGSVAALLAICNNAVAS